ncbi:hypothetical protein TNCV_3757941 [Trichonephila clavipes]|nr:hypothetical protein TNCV_3757941 [Trichonephila clavipes]
MAESIPDELKSSALETIEIRYPATSVLTVSYLQETNGANAGWLCRLFKDSSEKMPPITMARGSQVMLGSLIMRKLTKKPNSGLSRLNRKSPRPTEEQGVG